MRLDRIAATKDAQGRLTGVTVSRAQTQAEMAQQDRENRIAALEAALKARPGGYTPPAPPNGYARP